MRAARVSRELQVESREKKTGFPAIFILPPEGKFFGFISANHRIPGIIEKPNIREVLLYKMRVKSPIVAVVILCAAVASQGKSCKYWCKSDHDDSYYCCQSGKPDGGIAQIMWPLMSSPIFWMGLIGTSLGIHAHANPPMDKPMKRTKCPPLRMICPRNFDYYDPPLRCDKDDECHPKEKCCYDVCLEHKTCKPAE